MIGSKTRQRRLMLSLLALCLIPALSSGQNSYGDDKKIIFLPYLWGTAISGTSTIGTLPPLDIDASFSDLFSNLNFGGSLHTEFVFNDWVFVIDPTYLSLEVDLTLPVPGPSPPTADLEVDIWLVEAWVGYRLTKNWEAIGGARYQSQDISASGLPNPPFPDNVGISVDFTDWFVGARFRTDLGDKWFMTLRGDVVIAGDSESSLNALLFFSRRVGKKGNKALNLGYRYLEHDFNDSGVYRWDVTQNGPVLGFSWAF
jgi:hypothetical protein